MIERCFTGDLEGIEAQKSGGWKSEGPGLGKRDKKHYSHSPRSQTHPYTGHSNFFSQVSALSVLAANQIH